MTCLGRVVVYSFLQTHRSLKPFPTKFSLKFLCMNPTLMSLRTNASLKSFRTSNVLLHFCGQAV